MTDPTLAKLREILLNEFSEDELRALCASISIDYDKLAGTGTFGKTRALIDTAKSQDKLRALQASVREAKPAAYEAVGFATPTELEPPLHAPATPVSRNTASLRSSVWPWLALAAVVLLCTIAGVTMLLPRLQTASPSAVNTALAVATATAPPTNAAATETPPAIVDMADGLDKGAGVLTDTAPALEATPSTTEATSTPPTESTAASAVTIITVTATSTPASAAEAITSTTAPTNTHPSINVIRSLNDQLPRFYTGEVDAQGLQQYWTGEALRSVVAFGTVRLPRALRLQPSQRNTIQATYAYRREPALVSEGDGTATVSSREFWRYATSANATEICEVRDYVYNLVRVDGQFKVSTFNSRIVDSGCAQQ